MLNISTPLHDHISGENSKIITYIHVGEKYRLSKTISKVVQI